MAAGYQRACSRVRDTPVACNSRREPALPRGRRPTPLARSVSSPGQGPEKAHRKRAHRAPITARINGYGRSSCEARPARSLWWSAYRCPVWSVATVAPCSRWGLARASAGPVGLPPCGSGYTVQGSPVGGGRCPCSGCSAGLCAAPGVPQGARAGFAALRPSPPLLGFPRGGGLVPGVPQETRERRSAVAGYVKV